MVKKKKKEENKIRGYRGAEWKPGGGPDGGGAKTKTTKTTKTGFYDSTFSRRESSLNLEMEKNSKKGTKAVLTFTKMHFLILNSWFFTYFEKCCLNITKCI